MVQTFYDNGFCDAGTPGCDKLHWLFDPRWGFRCPKGTTRVDDTDITRCVYDDTGRWFSAIYNDGQPYPGFPFAPNGLPYPVIGGLPAPVVAFRPAVQASIDQLNIDRNLAAQWSIEMFNANPSAYPTGFHYTLDQYYDAVAHGWRPATGTTTAAPPPPPYGSPTQNPDAGVQVIAPDPTQTTPAYLLPRRPLVPATTAPIVIARVPAQDIINAVPNAATTASGKPAPALLGVPLSSASLPTVLKPVDAALASVVGGDGTIFGFSPLVVIGAAVAGFFLLSSMGGDKHV